MQTLKTNTGRLRDKQAVFGARFYTEINGLIQIRFKEPIADGLRRSSRRNPSSPKNYR